MDLAPYRLDLEIINATVSQLKKDLGDLGSEITFSGNAETASGELIRQLKSVISRLIERDPGQLAALLYRIDLDERILKELPGRPPEFLPAAILEREFKKVVIRKLHSKK